MVTQVWNHARMQVWAHARTHTRARSHCHHRHRHKFLASYTTALHFTLHFRYTFM